MLDHRQLDATTIQVRQLRRPPMVNLDHWAFRLFSENQEMRQVLTGALKERNGTLAIGRLNLLEFTRVTDVAQLRGAEEFIQSLLPHVFFLDVQVMDVVQRENEQRIGAAGDQVLLDYIGSSIVEHGQWRAPGCLCAAQGRRSTSSALPG
jgi:hypothetical protein